MILEKTSVDLDTARGAMRTYIYRPKAAGRYPGVVLYSEIFQLTEPISRIAALLSGHGYVVAVPEVYHELEPAGTVLGYDPAGADAGNRHKVEKAIEDFDDDARVVLDHLESRDDCTGKLLTMGVCLGGHLAFRCAFDPRVKAAACFYATDIHKGSLGSAGDDSLARAGDIKGELMMVWGRQDPHVPDEGRALIQSRLRETSVHFSWHEFNAVHAFLRDDGPRYDPALALLSYRMVFDLFARVGH